MLFAGERNIGSTRKTISVNEDLLQKFSYKEREYAYWGDANRYPDDALEVIGTTGVLSTALNYKSRCCYGQGVIPMTLTGIEENGS